jgi:four helix bundle protein
MEGGYKMNDFRELTVWNKSRCLLLAAYKVTETFPQHELHGLTNQIRNSCVSILVNIERGFSKKRQGELACFLRSSKKSAKQLEDQIKNAHHRYFMRNLDYQYLVRETNEISGMLSACIQKLKNDN